VFEVKDVELAVLEKPKNESSKEKTAGTVIIIKDLLTRRRRLSMEPPRRKYQY